MSCVYETQLEGKRVRYVSIGIFGLLYTGFTIMLGIRLNDWNDALPGRCYRTSRIALPTAKHPFVDQIYLGFTSFYVYCLMVVTIMLCRTPSTRLYYQKNVITVGILQFVLHVYTLVALRISNQPLLDNVALEDEWGFGQVIALVMLVATLLECAKGLEGKDTNVKLSPRCSQLCTQNTSLGRKRKLLAWEMEEKKYVGSLLQTRKMPSRTLP